MVAVGPGHLADVQREAQLPPEGGEKLLQQLGIEVANLLGGDNASQAHEKLYYAFLIRDKGMIELKAMVYEVASRRVGIYIPSIGLEKLITMADQRTMGIKDSRFDEGSRSLTLVFEEKKEEEKKKGRGVKYVPVKKLDEDKGEAKEKEITIRPFDEIYVGVYADSKPPLELLFKILRKA